MPMLTPDDRKILADLRPGSLFNSSIQYDFSGDPEDEDDERTFTVASRYTDDEGRKHVLIVRNRSVLAVWADERPYSLAEYDEYRDARTDDEGNEAPGTLTESEWDDLHHLSIGDEVSDPTPVVDVFYPAVGIHSDNVEWAAVQVIDQSVTIVEIRGGEYGFALTGAGQRMDWTLCAAYIGVGQLPPVSLAGGLPNMAGHADSESGALTVAACLASLDRARDLLAYERAQLAERFPGIE